MAMPRAALVPLALLVTGCGTLLGRGGPEPSNDPLSRALVAMEAARFETAERELRPLVSSCTGGRGEVESLLLMGVLHLDPRFEGRDPPAAARYAARAIRHPAVAAVELDLARGIYLASRDLGSPPLEGTLAEGEVLPVGFTAPDLPVPQCPPTPGVERGLPRHPGPVMASSIAQARAALDSVTAAPAQVVRTEAATQESSTSEEEQLRARVQRLEAELARIRKLLRGGG